MILSFLLILGFSTLLVKSTDWIVSSLRYLIRGSGLGKYSFTGLILGLATSLPELSVSIAASVAGNPNLVLGNVIGSNIVDLSLVVGGGALLAGAVHAHGEFLKQDAFFAFLAGALPMLLLIDGRLGIGDGLILLTAYVVYSATVLREEQRDIARKSVRRESFPHHIIMTIRSPIGASRMVSHLGWLLAGTAGMIISAEGLVHSAVALARDLHAPVLVVGIFLIAVGTSLPELAFEIRALRLREAKMVLGNLMGSVVANATLILGLAAVIRPIQLNGGTAAYLTATLAYVVLFSVFYWFTRTKRRLDRWEGAALVGLYALFVFIELR